MEQHGLDTYAWQVATLILTFSSVVNMNYLKNNKTINNRCIYLKGVFNIQAFFKTFYPQLFLISVQIQATTQFD